MRCYFTGEECDCGGDMESECPHDDMAHDDVLEDHGVDEYIAQERRVTEMSERLDQCRPNS